MAISWTTDQALALAPDASSAKAGRELSSAGKWVTLGRRGEAIWGECKGSGASPYRTQVDLTEPAFRCSCPSRKFPCKHGLGLMLIFAADPAALADAEPPAWVSEWLASRAERAEKQTQKATEPEKPADTAAQAKRAAQREAKVAGGVQELDRWMRDLMRGGFAEIASRLYSYWDTPAKRMVDAQAPGLARMMREMAGIPATGSGWQERLLERLGRLHLLLQGYGRLETLPAETQADIRTAMGFNVSQEQVLAEPGVRDRWFVAAQRVEEEEQLRVQRTWLWGEQSGSPALVLSFAHASQPIGDGLVPGSLLDADLAFFPGAFPLRALVKTRHEAVPSVSDIPAHGYPTIELATAAYAAALARSPWLDRYPFALRDVFLAASEGQWEAQDTEGHALPISPSFAHGWRLMGIAGGRPVTLWGEWNGASFLPLSAWADGRFYALPGGAQ
ncbi:MAG: SWIM zinc finger family protein [Capsulimonas sp.]|uniref:SWIM zinc finger family protein n=1 Tax=Capsulimonas sp. TaxID=2494211 RepID=UPI003267321F